MFINPSKFEKELKKAWNHQGVTILRTDEEIAIDAGTWFCEFKLAELTNEIHAALVRTVGWLPMVQEVYEYHKGDQGQMVIRESATEGKELLQKEGTMNTVAETPLIMNIPGDDEWRIIQDKTERLLAVKEKLMEVVDWKQTKRGEKMPVPYLYNGRIVWANDGTIFTINAYREVVGMAQAVMAALEMTGRTITTDKWPSAMAWERVR